jgi:hypothetical protein
MTTLGGFFARDDMRVLHRRAFLGAELRQAERLGVRAAGDNHKPISL